VAALSDPATVVVRGIDWVVRPGERWLVGGLQGSGKSNFLMTVAGLMAPATGSYRLFGELMPIFDEARLAARLWLGLVFETGQLFNHLTVRENIALPLRYHDNLSKAHAAEEVQRFLAALELEPWADSTPGALGRIWQKRVGLGRALILQPYVLLLDNPLAALDLRHAEWWLQFLAGLSKGHELLHGRPLTLVMTTADLRPWESQDCRFAVIRDQQFSVLGNWKEMEKGSSGLMHDLLLRMTESSGVGKE
jgi:ABC-type transporter Mla maintaining outer membrane lipid asymmetry ATPase subunit MlaF